MRYRLLVCMLCSVVCISCSSNQGVDLNAVRDTINIRYAQDKAPDTMAVTQESLKDVTQKLIRVRIPAQKTSFFAAHVATNGSIETFMSRSGQSISFNAARIVATRGLGFDLIGAEQGTRKRLAFLNDNHQSRTLIQDCKAPRLGNRVIEIAEISRQARYEEEQCVTGSWEHTDRYWTSTTGAPLKTQQFLGPDLDYVQVEWLN